MIFPVVFYTWATCNTFNLIFMLLSAEVIFGTILKITIIWNRNIRFWHYLQWNNQKDSRNISFSKHLIKNEYLYQAHLERTIHVVLFCSAFCIWVTKTKSIHKWHPCIFYIYFACIFVANIIVIYYILYVSILNFTTKPDSSLRMFELYYRL